MSVPDEIDDLIGKLRSPALPSELGDEQQAIAAMARAFQSSAGRSSAHHPSEEKITMRNTSRRVRVGVLVATGIIGFGGVAAAGPGGVFDNGEASDEVATTTTTTTEVPGSTTTVAVTVQSTTTVAAATTTTVASPQETPAAVAELLAEVPPTSLVDDPETTFDETMCLEGNHGKTVSAVARGELVIPDIDVVDAAHSSCGKQDAADDEDSADEVEPTNAEDDAEQGPAKEKDKNNGNGQANGRGRGNPHDD